MANSLSAIDWDGKFRSDSWNSEIHIWWEYVRAAFSIVSERNIQYLQPRRASARTACLTSQARI